MGDRDVLPALKEAERHLLVSLADEEDTSPRVQCPLLPRHESCVPEPCSELEQLTARLHRLQREYGDLSERHEHALGLQREAQDQRTRLLQQMAGLQAEIDVLRDEHRLQVRRFQQAEAEIRELSETLLRVSGRLHAVQALEAELDLCKQTCEGLTAERQRLLGLLDIRARTGSAPACQP